MNKKLLTIIIVNWEREADTLECLSSLENCCKDYNSYDVILVDNASKQGIKEIENRKFLYDLTIIRNEENLGFTGGNNIGLDEAIRRKSEYILLLNNDTKVLNDIVYNNITLLNANNKIGVLGLVNFYYDRPNLIWQAAKRFDSLKIKLKEIDVSMFEDDLIEVDSVPGSSMFIRSDAIKKAGFLDDNYFAYWEEIDLCRRIKKIGYSIVVNRNSKILHKVKTSTPTELHLYLSTRNILYFHKKLSPIIIVLIHFVRLFGRFLIKKIIGLEDRKFVVLYTAYKDFLTNNMGQGSINKIIG